MTPAARSLLAAGLLVLGISGCGEDEAQLAEPTVVVGGQAKPGPLAVDVQGIHWVNAGDGAVMSLATEATTAAKLATVEGGASDVATDENRIFWATAGDDGAVAWVDKHEGDVHELTSGEGRLTAIALDETCVFWSSHGGDGGTVRTMWKDGGEITTIADEQSAAVARDLSGIFWLAGGDDDTVVRRAKQLGDAAIDAGAAAGTAGQLIVRNAEVFWTVTTAEAGAGVWRASADGGDAKELATGPAPPVAMALGPADVYWADAAGGIWRVGRSGGEPEQMTALDRPAADLAFSSDVLYGTDRGAGAQDGAIWKLSVVP